VKRHHSMPFGAEWRGDGSTRFRLWAPAADTVQLELAGGINTHLLPLNQLEDNWFEVVADAVKPGAEYRFKIGPRMDSKGAPAQFLPDPASRFQPHDVHGPSAVIDPQAFEWHDDSWRGRPWEEAVIYELHVGAFTAAGTFAAVGERLDYLVDLGVTAIELMPVSDFAGKRNWGYDGVYHFAPDSSYGRPEDLKRLVQEAHRRGLMMLLDVVYNHFGPEGNYLGVYAPQFFTDRHTTPWGNGINFDGPQSRAVRDFFIHNAIYWLNEYNFDGLRFDAVHAIADDSKRDILVELADDVRKAVELDRHIHLILENDRNESHYLRRTEIATRGSTRKTSCDAKSYEAQWNDDIHHALHVLITSEKDGYYSDYVDQPLAQLGRCLSEGFAYQGETSVHRNGAVRGEGTEGVPLTAFISFLQNHDQIGNRAFGERITQLVEGRSVRAAMEILLLAPSPPMLFMGEEFAAATPFLFFCDFEKDLAAAVTNGRRNEFAHFAAFRDAASRERIPDPNAAATFEASKLDWHSVLQRKHEEWLEFYKELLQLRRKKIVPLLAGACHLQASYKIFQKRGLSASWIFQNGAKLALMANLGVEPLFGVPLPPSIIYQSPDADVISVERGGLRPWSVVWSLES
jgi:maltooligosyltrehalose trehalohydrolase